jgi:UDP-galactopyranose mutase
MASVSDLVVFSHLRWNFVFQRPQHLLTRLANNQRVVFIEEPVFDSEADPHVELIHVSPSILVVRPYTNIDAGGFAEEQLPILSQLIQQVVASERIESCVAWFYTPLALPLLNCVPHELVIYDCMDALDAFLNAPTLLKQRETELLEQADLVFTGGPSLFKRLEGRHANAYCFPSSVDASHYSKALEEISEPEDQAAISRPRLGYFGVIDERIDLALIDTVASQHPDWHFVMVGPVVKISQSELPRRPNIHYLGQKQYAELPNYLASWDVCMMPFAINDSTKYISPTKTLEYMAAEKPIVSTPIADVAEPYGRIVEIASTPQEFASAVDRLLNLSAEQRQQQTALMRQVLSKTSWDETASQMQNLLDEAIELKSQPVRNESVPAGSSNDKSSKKSPPVLIVGAGPTGLSAAYHLGSDALLIEQNDRIGGWCRSVVHDGFVFDYAGHIMFSNEPYVHELYKILLGDNVHWQDREAWVYSKKTFTRYPFQASLHGLPADVITECIMGAIEARFGAAKTAPPTRTAEPSKVCVEGDVKDCCADGVLESTTKLARPTGSTNGNGAPKANGAASGNGSSNGKHSLGSSVSKADGEPANFEEFIYKVWGAGIAKHFAVPYNRKLWAVPLEEMETSWLGGRVPMPDLEEMIAGALQPVPKPMGPNARFGYPLRGGFQSLMDGFLPYVEDQLVMNQKVVAVSPTARTITLADGRVLSFEQLISTMPLPVLIRLMGDEAPAEVQAAVDGLRHVSVRCVHLGVGREHLTDKHWIYYPEETVFHRIFVQGNASPHCNPAGGFGLTCEITYSPHKPLPCDGEALVQRCIDDCRKVGIIGQEDPIWTSLQMDMPFAYVVYDHARPHNVATIRNWLKTQSIVLAGRYSEWEYYNSDHAFIAGKRAAEAVQSLRSNAAVPGLSARGLGTTITTSSNV